MYLDSVLIMKFSEKSDTFQNGKKCTIRKVSKCVISKLTLYIDKSHINFHYNSLMTFAYILYPSKTNHLLFSLSVRILHQQFSC